MHSLLSASKAAVWGPLGCQASPLMSVMVPGISTPESLEGDAAHALGESMIQAHAGDGRQLPLPKNTIDTVAANGVLITKAIYDSAQIYATSVVKTFREVAQNDKNVKLLLEEPLDCTDIHQECGGTADCIILSKASLFVYDFKNGHRPVDAFENWQCITYAAGAFSRFGLDGHTDQKMKFIARIVQPNCYDGKGPIRWWITQLSDLRGYFNRLREAAEIAMSGAAPCKSGRHCMSCSARFGCETAIKGALQLYEAVGVGGEYTLASKKDIETVLCLVMTARERLESIKEALKGQVEQKLKAGERGDLFEMEMAYGRRKWSAPKEVIRREAGELWEAISTVELSTPLQAIAAGMREDVVNRLSTVPVTGARLTEKSTDKARGVFYGE